ncbi:hypothetical protein EG329_008792 [Mollisiaceae sp. DMI_Dod_QoI]|nr:hypothetical protein EG329_008792 [Helotiales sp. DMI_Dod_QoI]
MEAPDSSGSLDLMANPGQMFEVFDKLPIELRLKIWKLSIPKDRVVAITDRRIRDFESGSGFQAEISARYTVPASMQACQEARNEIKKQYTPILKAQLGYAVLFNFQHDTLLMDGPEGTITMWSFEKAARRSNESRKELVMIHQNLKHLAIHGQRLLCRTINEAQQYTNLETLVLPFNPFWNCPLGHHAFNLRISERMRLRWTEMKEEQVAKEKEEQAAKEKEVRIAREEAKALPSEVQNKSLDGYINEDASQATVLPRVRTDTHYVEPLDDDSADFSQITCTTSILFSKEEDLQISLAGGTRVTLSYIDGPDHPGLRRAEIDFMRRLHSPLPFPDPLESLRDFPIAYNAMQAHLQRVYPNGSFQDS